MIPKERTKKKTALESECKSCFLSISQQNPIDREVCHFTHVFSRCIASLVASLSLNAVSRNQLTPFFPKPALGVPTTAISCSILSKKVQLSSPNGQLNQIYGELIPPVNGIFKSVSVSAMICAFS